MPETDLTSPRKPTTVYLKDYRPPEFFIKQVNLDFTLREKATAVYARLSIKRNGDHAQPLVLDGEKLVLKQLRIDGSVLQDEEYALGAESLSIEHVPDSFVLEIETELQPQDNTELSGLYQSSGNYCTQCEAEGFRRITYFLDRPDVLAVYQVKITADIQACPVLLSNGNPTGTGDNGDGTHWASWSDPHPKPSYLFALVAGDLEHISDRFQTMSGRDVTLNIYTQAHNIDQCEHAMRALKQSMAWDEKTYGREYDLDVYNIVAVDDFNMGAMENKGLNIFNSKYVLANRQTATDSDFDGIESVIGHEYFHNWSGNRVTCRDWFQLSLKEGFTVFRDQEFSADMGSRGVKRIRDVQTLRAYQFKEDAGPMAHPVRPDAYQEINNFYTLTVYEKGAEVIRMMHSMVGRVGFRKATDHYFDTYDGQAVTTEDFVKCVEQANNIDLTQFRLWYTQAGTPHVNIRQSQDGNELKLKITQSCPPSPGQQEKEPFQIPLAMAVLSPTGEKVVSDTLLLTEPEQDFHFTGVPSGSVVSMLRGFSAPVKLTFDQSDRELALLCAIDDNDFARWEALQRLSLNLILPAITDGAIDETRYKRLLDTLRTVLDKMDDDALLAEMLSLPSNAYIAELCSPITPKRVCAVRQELVKKLGVDLQEPLQNVYQLNHNQGDERTAEASAQRALKNTALAYLVATQKTDYYELASEQYFSANNMTDRIAAFSVLVHENAENNQLLVDDFYRQWQSNPLVLDKWFAIQATQPDTGALKVVKKLEQHPEFSLRNPNKVRSLIGAFANNMQAFHQPDGGGYQYVADKVIELNSINPQIAARLAGAFNSWRSYGEPLSEMMKKEILRINSQENLTRDVKEIVSKALT